MNDGDRTPGPADDQSAAVDAATRRLADLAQASLDEQVQVYDDVQQRLHEALVQLDES